MYVLYVDESGSHGLFQNNKAYVLAGVAIHEADIRPLGDRLRDVALEVVPDEATVARYELHAAELRRPPPDSPWNGVDGQVRRRTLERALHAIASFEEHDPRRPLRVFVDVLAPQGEHERERVGDARPPRRGAPVRRLDGEPAPAGRRPDGVGDVAPIRRRAARPPLVADRRGARGPRRQNESGRFVTARR